MRHALVLAALLAAAPAVARSSASVQDRTAQVDKIFSWVKPGMPGCLAAASQDGTLVVNRAYGLADLERDVPLTTESLLDAGSIRKQFVAAAILLLVEEGKLSLSDDVRKHIPELHDFGHTITIDHLLTHTSGIRDWVPLLNWAGGDPDVMSLILRQRTLNFVPGTEWSYSNSGYVLLPELVARVSGMTFPEFLHTRVLDPLGMKHSRYVDDPDIVIRNRALAYEPQSGGMWKADMRLGNERGGAGALFTTASDLVRWNDALHGGRLGKFVTEKIQEPATLANGRKLTYARGLSLLTEQGTRIVVHGGGAAAYRSFAAHFPDQRISVAVLCNAGEASDARDDFAGHIFDLLTGKGMMGRPSTPPPAGVAGVDVSGRAGLRSMEGETRVYRRAQRYAPAADDLNAFAGRYGSDELLAVLELTPTAQGLAARLNDARPLGAELRPVDPDGFQFANFSLRFVRDSAGKVVALDLTTPVFRNVRFTRR